MLAQFITATHLHGNDVDAAPQADCAICIQASQNDDLDLPIPIVMPEMDFSVVWAMQTEHSQSAIPVFEAKARAPPYF